MSERHARDHARRRPPRLRADVHAPRLPRLLRDARQRLEYPCRVGGFDVRAGNVLYGSPPRPPDVIVLEMREAEERFVMLVMINAARLRVPAATVGAALAGRYGELLPLVVASGGCRLISPTIVLRWRPASRRHTGTGHISERNG